MTGSEEGRPAEENPTQQSQLNPPESAASAGSPPAIEPAPGDRESSESEAGRRKPILIGSQRDPAAYRARPKRDWAPVEEGGDADDGGNTPPAEQGRGGDGRHRSRHRGGRGHHDRREPTPQQTKSQSTGAQGPASAQPVAAGLPDQRSAVPAPDSQDEALRASVAALAGADLANLDTLSMARQPITPQPLPPPEPLFPQPAVHAAADEDSPVIPGRRQKLSATMEAEMDRAMGGLSLDDLMSGGEQSAQEGGLEPESRHRGRVVAIRRDEIFVEFGGREQGCLSARSMEKLPQPGDVIEVIVQRFNAEEGLYDLSLPGASVDLGNWDEVHEGMLVDVQVTGHNTGGLECEVNHVRGFIPVSQVSLYRVEDMAQFVGQKFACLITEANASRKNIVLSRRAVLEREQEEKKQAFMEALAPGQVYEGTVRKLMDFGAFVELGNGVDGLLHISQLSWGRIKHPSEVLQEGQPVRVRIEKIDRENGRIGLSYREMIENPWTAAAGKYPHNAIVRGKVTRLMEFGAFVELEPGIEGLVHISELSHKRIWRASDVVKEGEEVEVLVLNVNPQAQRMSLSIKGLSRPEPTKKEKEEAEEAELPVATKQSSRPSNRPLKGGLGRPTGGESLGLKW